MVWSSFRRPDTSRPVAHGATAPLLYDASVRRLARLTAVTLALGACSTTAQEPSAGNGEVAATIGDRHVTIEELDARWQSINPAEHAQAMRTLYEGRRSALDGIIADALLEAESATRGVTPDELLAQETATRAQPVSDAEVVAFFNENPSQMQGRSLELMRPAIRSFLEDQRELDARDDFLSELRAGGPSVEVLLDPQRHEIALTDADPAIGNPDALVTLVEFSDFQCPYCEAVTHTLRQLRENYTESIRIVWKDFPLTQIHPDAFRAAEAGHCADEQGRFWEIHDVLFANQDALDDASLKAHAAGLGLDTAVFDTCLDESRYGTRVRAGMDIGTGLGVDSTPMIFVNGRQLSGAQPYDVFAAMIDDELERAGR